MFKMWVMTLLVGIVLEATVEASVCPINKEYWNGTSCVPCGLCLPGFGLKSPCTKEKNTECQPCVDKYDYSEETSRSECILCNAHSNCAAESAKVIRNCSVTAPPICDGCIDNFFYDTALSVCRKCLECQADEYEERSCNTSHNRKCAPLKLPSSDPPTVETTKTTPGDSSRDPLPTVYSPSDDPRDPLPPDGEIDEPLPATEEPQQAAASGSKDNTLIFVLSGIAVIVLPIAVFAGFKRYKSIQNRRRGTTVNQQEIVELLHMSNGTVMLDSQIGNLPIAEKKKISSALNGKDGDGFCYWQRVAERLRFREESRGWRNSTNPTENLLRKYSESQGSTVRGFLKALKEEDLLGLLYCYPNWKILIDTMDQEIQCTGNGNETTMTATCTSPV